MQIQFKNMLFGSLLICSAFVGAQNETVQFISLVDSYYKKLTLDSTVSLPRDLAQIKRMLPGAQKRLRNEVANQKSHAKKLKQDADATYSGSEEEAVETARLQLQATLRESQDISPLKTAITQAQWILSPRKEALNKKALAAIEDAQDASAQLTDAEEKLDTAWQKLQEN